LCTRRLPARHGAIAAGTWLGLWCPGFLLYPIDLYRWRHQAALNRQAVHLHLVSMLRQHAASAALHASGWIICHTAARLGLAAALHWRSAARMRTRCGSLIHRCSYAAATPPAAAGMRSCSAAVRAGFCNIYILAAHARTAFTCRLPPARGVFICRPKRSIQPLHAFLPRTQQRPGRLQQIAAARRRAEALLLHSRIAPLLTR